MKPPKAIIWFVLAAIAAMGAIPAMTPAPTDATYICQTANSTLSAEQPLSALSTGVLKVTTTTGALTTAVAGTDYLAPSGSGAALTGVRSQASVSWLAGNLAQNTSYYVGQVIAAPSTTAALRRIYVPTACTLTKAYGWWTSTNASSNETSTVIIRKNNSSNTTVATAAIGASNTPVAFNNAAVALSLAAGDYIEVRIDTSTTFATAPNSVYGGITLEFTQ